MILQRCLGDPAEGSVLVDIMSIVCKEEVLKRSSRPRNWIDYKMLDSSSWRGRSSSQNSAKNQKKENNNEGSKSPRHRKVSARWSPAESCKPDIEDAPVFYPTVEEFQDTLGYLRKVAPIAGPYGICRIVAPKSWVPPCPLKEKDIWEHAKFSTRIQQVDLLQNREPMKKKNRGRKRKRKRNSRMGTSKTSSCLDSSEASTPSDADDKFGFQTGSDFTFEEFQKHADMFKRAYFGMKCDRKDAADDTHAWEPSVEEIEGEYWRIIEEPTDDIEVQSCDHHYLLQFVALLMYISVIYNFLNICRFIMGRTLKLEYLPSAMKKHLPDLFEEQPGLLHELVTQLSPSVLKSEGVPVYRVVQQPGEFVLTFPRAYHAGFNCGFNCAEAVNVAPVDWLSHGQSAVELYSEQRRKTSLSHDKLLLESACEAVRCLWEIYVLKKVNSKNLSWKSACGEDGILTKAVKTRIQMEEERLESLPISLRCQKMERDFDLNNEKECFQCFYDLHLSAASCICSPEKFACPRHANSICSCEIANKFILVRYSFDELQKLVEALEGNLDALRVWTSKGYVKDLVSDTEQCGFEAVENDEPDLHKAKRCKQEDVSVCFYTNSSGNNDHGHLKEEAHIIYGGNKEQVHPCCQNHKAVPVDGVSGVDLNIERSNGEVISIVSKNCNGMCSEQQSSRLEVLNQNDAAQPLNYCRHAASRVGLSFSMNSADKCSCCSLESLVNPDTDHLMLQKADICVKVLNIGQPMPGKRWCCKNAIFPKGFRSCVQFPSLLNPNITCNYMSEVIDAGLLGPLFKVAMEDHPDLTFIDVSPQKCWEMVLEKLHQKVEEQKGQGLLSVQLEDAIDGLKMFGFCSSSIINAIEALDPSHQCLEYWNSKTLNNEFRTSGSSGSLDETTRAKTSSVEVIKQEQAISADSGSEKLVVKSSTENVPDQK
ncbi:hypothetical protein QQ045_023136 [Rhodiola kirilowii]